MAMSRKLKSEIFEYQIVCTVKTIEISGLALEPVWRRICRIASTGGRFSAQNVVFNTIRHTERPLVPWAHTPYTSPKKNRAIGKAEVFRMLHSQASSSHIRVPLKHMSDLLTQPVGD
jgi:hypothetical protein